MSDLVKIGCAAGFAGDRGDASLPIIAELARHAGPRFLMFETLAERTLALCQLEKRRDASRGYSPALERMVPTALGPALQAGVRIIGNFGGANPAGAARRVAAWAREAGFPEARIAVVEGDDLTQSISIAELQARETGGTVLAGEPDVVAANVYLGAEGIARALDDGADVVITGRVADPSLALGPLVHAHGWSWTDWDRLADGTLAGHLLECGAQVTGGYFADPGVKDVPDFDEVGYPIVEMTGSGAMVVTKPRDTGGLVDRRTVTEQILYEVHDPAAYVTPDVVLDITGVALAGDGPDRIRLAGAAGKPRPDTLKATVFVEAGLLGEAEISYAGPNAVGRARLAAETVTRRLRRRAPELALRVDLVGVSSIFGNLAAPDGATRAGDEPTEVRLRVAAQDTDRSRVELMLNEVESLYCAGPAGGAGVRRHLTPRLASASCLIERDRAAPRVWFLGDAS